MNNNNNPAKIVLSQRKEYKPETPFLVSEDGSLVYNLKQNGWDSGKPRMVNDVWIPINAPKEHRVEIAKAIMNALNKVYQ